MIPEAVVRDAGLRPARRGPQRGLRRVLRRGAAQRGSTDAEAKLVITADGQYRRGTAVAAEGRRRRGRRGHDSPVEHVLVVRRTGIDVAWTEGRDVWWHELVGPAVRARTRRRRSTPSNPLFILYTSGHHREAQGHPAHLRRLPHPGRVHPPRRVRPQARQRRLLVHRRHRLGHRAQLHRLRTAGQPGHRGDLRGHPEHPARGPALGDHRQVRRVDLLHRARP